MNRWFCKNPKAYAQQVREQFVRKVSANQVSIRDREQLVRTQIVCTTEVHCMSGNFKGIVTYSSCSGNVYKLCS